MHITSKFEDIYGYLPDASSFTPGRVNLIGEHIDYNSGMVLPTALDLGISISLKARDDKRVRIYSDQFSVMSEVSIDDKAADDWSDYALGAIVYANEAGFLTGGADIAMSSTVPTAAGLSSSSALTVGILKLTRDLAGNDMSDTEVSVLARRLENEFIGMPCGIMDQMAVAIAKPGQALALDTKSLAYEVIDMPLDYHMAVLHSGQYRRNADGNYKARKEECDAVKAALGHDDICLISDADFLELRHLPDVLQRRARHCMTEHRRTVAAAQALKDNNIELLGRLMIESHASMRDDFEMSLPPIDQLVHDAVDFGAIGARLTGGGFGGCIVACVAKDKLEAWTKRLLASHPAAFAVA